ncbi:DUF4886 domain-containing protein [Verrucomicrobiales bacterium BCK34]|nr:DUF4886 domain-containing protein [Verrucomicrobiales bacterium BCK34]
MNRLTFLLFSIALAFSPPLRGESEPVAVLTVGNSFADNALKFLPALAEASDRKLIAVRANLGGCTFERHWNHVAAFEKDPKSKAGSPYAKGTKSLDELLKSREWDFITIQQVSFKSHDLETYQPYADKLYHYIKERAPDAEILVHQIWAYRVDDPRFVPANAGKEPHTHKVMYEDVRAAYHAFADKWDLDILPSGDAMFAADTDPEWGYKPDTTFDFKAAKKPELPNQEHSLHRGWAWGTQNGKSFLRIDGHHAGRAGEYLIGCVWFEKLFGESVLGNTFVPDDIAPDYAAFLQQTAHEAVVAQTVEAVAN